MHVLVEYTKEEPHELLILKKKVDLVSKLSTCETQAWSAADRLGERDEKENGTRRARESRKGRRRTLKYSALKYVSVIH